MHVFLLLSYRPLVLPIALVLAFIMVRRALAIGTSASSSNSLLMSSSNHMSCSSMFVGPPSFVGSFSQRVSDGSSWRSDALRKVSPSTSREVSIVRLAVVGVLSPLLVPILLGGPFVLQGFLPLLEGGG